MTNCEDFGLPQSTKATLTGIFAANPKVNRVIIYGSRAKGNFKPGSDIDIDIVLVGTELNTSDLLRIEGQIDESLIPYQVDLSLIHQIDNPDLLDHIQRVGRIFYERPDQSAVRKSD